MIVSIQNLLIGLVLAAFLWVALDWALSLFRSWRDRAAMKKKENECHLCRRKFIKRAPSEIVECPSCGVMTTARGQRRLG